MLACLFSPIGGIFCLGGDAFGDLTLPATLAASLLIVAVDTPNL